MKKNKNVFILCGVFIILLLLTFIIYYTSKGTFHRATYDDYDQESDKYVIVPLKDQVNYFYDIIYRPKMEKYFEDSFYTEEKFQEDIFEELYNLKLSPENITKYPNLDKEVIKIGLTKSLNNYAKLKTQIYVNVLIQKILLKLFLNDQETLTPLDRLRIQRSGEARENVDTYIKDLKNQYANNECNGIKMLKDLGVNFENYYKSRNLTDDIDLSSVDATSSVIYLLNKGEKVLGWGRQTTLHYHDDQEDTKDPIYLSVSDIKRNHCLTKAMTFFLGEDVLNTINNGEAIILGNGVITYNYWEVSEEDHINRPHTVLSLKTYEAKMETLFNQIKDDVASLQKIITKAQGIIPLGSADYNTIQTKSKRISNNLQVLTDLGATKKFRDELNAGIAKLNKQLVATTDQQVAYLNNLEVLVEITAVLTPFIVHALFSAGIGALGKALIANMPATIKLSLVVTSFHIIYNGIVSPIGHAAIDSYAYEHWDKFFEYLAEHVKTETYDAVAQSPYVFLTTLGTLTLFQIGGVFVTAGLGATEVATISGGASFVTNVLFTGQCIYGMGSSYLEKQIQANDNAREAAEYKKLKQKADEALKNAYKNEQLYLDTVDNDPQEAQKYAEEYQKHLHAYLTNQFDATIDLAFLISILSHTSTNIKNSVKKIGSQIGKKKLSEIFKEQLTSMTKEERDRFKTETRKLHKKSVIKQILDNVKRRIKKAQRVNKNNRELCQCY